MVRTTGDNNFFKAGDTWGQEPFSWTLDDRFLAAGVPMLGPNLSAQTLAPPAASFKVPQREDWRPKPAARGAWRKFATFPGRGACVNQRLSGIFKRLMLGLA